MCNVALVKKKCVPAGCALKSLHPTNRQLKEVGRGLICNLIPLQVVEASIGTK
jgi:hypothetical protein